MSSWRISARLMPCSRAISASRPRSSAERSIAAVAAPGVTSWHRRSSVTDGGRDAERDAGALQQRRALLLERAAADHLGLDVGEPGEHRVGVALADGRALGEDELEQVAGRVDLRVQVDEQLGLEDRAHDCISL